MTRVSAAAALLSAAVSFAQAPPPRSGVISGRVIDEFGDPVINARVFAEGVGISGGRTQAPVATSTNDRGDYRVARVPAGTWVVAVIRIGGTVVFSPTGPVVFSSGGRTASEKIYYPGTASSVDAEQLTIASGQEHSRVDFVLRAERPTLPPVAAARIAQAGGVPWRNPDATAVIRGRVGTMDGRALPRAHLHLVPEADLLQSAATVADANGRFEFRDLAAGRFRVVASKPGYAVVEPDRADASAPASERVVELTASETRDRVDLTLGRWGAVSGTVLDEVGAPVLGASVQLLAIRYSRGRRRLVGVGQAANLSDDLGRYRIFAVQPGQYVVSATVGGASTADLPGYARAFFPGTSNAAEAQFISVGRSQEVTNIDVSLSRTRTARIAGQVLNAAGVPTNPGSLTLLPSVRSTSVVAVQTGARLSTDGSFEFPNVPPGQYIIRADRGRSNHTEGEFGTVPVAVTGTDITGVILQTSAGSSIKGRFRFDSYNTTKLPAPSAVELAPMPVDYDLAPANTATAAIDSDWNFELAGINGLRRLQLLRVPAVWTLKEVRVRGVDLIDRPIVFGRSDQSLTDVEVVLTDRLTELAGTVIDDRRRPVARSPVIVFSTDRSQRYAASRFMSRTSGDANGRFSVRGLPFGSYYVVAMVRLPFSGDDDWQDPTFLESILPRASSVVIGEAQTQLLTLRVWSP